MSEETTSTAKSPSPDFLNNIYVWIVGAIILLIAGWFGYRYLAGSSENYKLTLIYAPKEATEGLNSAFTWRIDGPPVTIHHTAIHLGLTPQSQEFNKDVKPADTQYTETVADFVSGDFDTPLQFTGNIILKNPGKYYYRLHAVIKDKNYWTDEYSLEVKSITNGVSLINAPTEVIADNIFAFTWRVDGPPNTINHTSVHFGQVSTPGDLGKNVRPSDTKYSGLVTEFINGTFDIPLQFVGNVSIATPGAYFYRAHAVIDRQNYWTEEHQLLVKEPVAEVTEAVTAQTPTPTETTEEE